MSVHSLMIESEDSDSGSDRKNSEKPEEKKIVRELLTALGGRKATTKK